MQTMTLFLKSLTWVVAAMLATVLTGCSGHPGAGDWSLDESSVKTTFKGLQIKFDGSAVLYPNGENTATVKCRWHAVTAENIALFCQSEQSLEDPQQGTEYALHTTLEGEKRSARLFLQDELMGEFSSR